MRLSGQVCAARTVALPSRYVALVLLPGHARHVCVVATADGQKLQMARIFRGPGAAELTDAQKAWIAEGGILFYSLCARCRPHSRPCSHPHLPSLLTTTTPQSPSRYTQKWAEIASGGQDFAVDGWIEAFKV